MRSSDCGLYPERPRIERSIADLHNQWRNETRQNLTRPSKHLLPYCGRPRPLQPSVVAAARRPVARTPRNPCTLLFAVQAGSCRHFRSPPKPGMRQATLSREASTNPAGRFVAGTRSKDIYRKPRVFWVGRRPDVSAENWRTPMLARSPRSSQPDRAASAFDARDFSVGVGTVLRLTEGTAA